MKLGVGVGVGHGNPVGERGTQLRDDEVAPQAVFELVGPHRRPLHLEELPVADVADELPVLILEGGQRQDPRAQLAVGRLDAQPVRLGERRFLVDHLLQDALVDPHLFEQAVVQVRAVGPPVSVDLLPVEPLELAGGDVAAVDRGEDIERGGAGVGVVEEVRNVQKDEREHHEGEAPLEPPPMAPHAVQHRHGTTYYMGSCGR